MTTLLPGIGIFHCVILLLMYGALATAQPMSLPEMPESRLQIQSWDTANGLPQDSVAAVAQTRDGFLWVATGNGLARFDGVHFQVYTRQNTPALTSNYITSLAVGGDGALWIATAAGGVTRWWNGQFQNWQTKDGLASNLVSALHVDEEGRVWAGSSKGLQYLHEGRWVAVGADAGVTGTVTYIVSNRRTGLWACTLNGLVNWHAGKLSRFGEAEGLPKGSVVAAFADRDESVLVSTMNGGVFRFQHGRFVEQPLPGWSTNRQVVSFTRDANGQLWLGSFGGGLAQLRDDGTLRVLDEDSGWPARTVYSVLNDREGNLWVGTIKGLYRLKHSPFAVLTRADGLHGSLVRVVYQDHAGTVWVGTDTAMHRFEGGRLAPVPDPAPQPHAFLSALDTSGRLLFGTVRTGIVQLTGAGYRSFLLAPELQKSFIPSLFETPDHRVWVGTNSAGLKIFDDHQQLVDSVTKAEGLPGPGIRSILRASDSSYWLATFEGLAHFAQGHWTSFTAKNGLLSDIIMALHEDRAGRVWIGSIDGLTYYDHGQFLSPAAASGLPSGSVFSILEDDQHGLWLGTGSGILHLTEHDLDTLVHHPESRIEPVLYGRESGLPSTQCSGGTQNVACKLTNGDLLFGTVDSVVWIRPSTVRGNPVAPTPFIEEARIDGQSAGRGHVTLPPSAHMAEVHFTSPGLTVPEKMSFRYRLEPFDADWIDAGSRRVAYYTNIPPGRYRFQVRSRNENGLWSPAPAEFELEALPHFWQTRWFAALLIGVTAGLIVLMYRLRIRRLRQEFELVLRERERIARELHDTVVQGYVGIASQLEAVAQEITSAPALAAVHLTMARRMSQHSLTEARRAVTELRVDHSVRLSLRDALRQNLAPLESRFGSQIRLDVPADLPTVIEPAQAQLVRIAQEAVTNALQHGRGSDVLTEVTFTPESLVLTVADSGQGFDASYAFSTMDGHFGLIGMRERARVIGAVIEVRSTPGSGTTVRVTVPAARAFSPKTGPNGGGASRLLTDSP